MKKVIVLMFLLPCMFIAQQHGVYSNFKFHEFNYNPAVAGSNNFHVAKFQFRNQWVGFNDAPTSVNGSWYGSYKNKAKHGYGLGIINEEGGLLTRFGMSANYAYHMKLNKKLKLGLGLRPGYLQYRTRLYDAVLADVGDEVLSGSVLSSNTFDVSTGAYLYSKKFYLSFSFYHILAGENAFTSLNTILNYQMNGMLGYTFTLNPKWTLQPNVLISYVDPLNPQVSSLLNVSFKERFTLGLSYRQDDAVGANFIYTHKDRLSVYYGFDISYSSFRQYNKGSHEIGISYIITKKRPSLEEEDDKLNNSILDDMNKKIEEEKEKEKKQKMDNSINL